MGAFCISFFALSQHVLFTIKLLNEAENHLEATGFVYMILSSRMKEFETSWNREIIKQEKYFFERLNLVRFSR